MNGVYFLEGVKIEKGKFGDGIERKVLFQIEQLEKIANINVVSLPSIRTKRDRIAFIVPFIKSKRERQRDVLIEASCNASFIYIRKPSLTKKFYVILKKIKKSNPKIIIFLEVPTYPFHKEYRGWGKVMALKSIFCENKLKAVVDRIVTYSDDKKIWGIKTIRISNSVDFSSISIRNMKMLEQDTIRLTSVANFTYWHGLDRLIKGIAEYKGKYNIVLNVVGEGREISNLKKLVDDLNLENQVRFTGFKTGNELTGIFNHTDIAVDSLGRHRSGVSYNSSLKGKEYAARGIPSISGVKTEFDYMPEFKYYLRVPADESAIRIDDIVAFYEEIYVNNTKNSIQEISETIRTFSFTFFDYSKGFLPVIKVYSQLMEEKLW